MKLEVGAQKALLSREDFDVISSLRIGLELEIPVFLSSCFESVSPGLVQVRRADSDDHLPPNVAGKEALLFSKAPLGGAVFTDAQNSSAKSCHGNCPFLSHVILLGNHIIGFLHSFLSLLLELRLLLTSYMLWRWSRL